MLAGTKRNFVKRCIHFQRQLVYSSNLPLLSDNRDTGDWWQGLSISLHLNLIYKKKSLCVVLAAVMIRYQIQYCGCLCVDEGVLLLYIVHETKPHYLSPELTVCLLCCRYQRGFEIGQRHALPYSKSEIFRKGNRLLCSSLSDIKKLGYWKLGTHEEHILLRTMACITLIPKNRKCMYL